MRSKTIAGGIMKFVLITFLTCFLCMIIFISCSQPSSTEKLKQEIISTDKAMSDLAVQEGFFKAILYYADDNITQAQ